MKQRWSFKGFGLIVLTCLFLCLPTAGWAAVYYVDIANGTDDGSHGGAPGTGAWKTLHYAIEESGFSDKDVLNVAAGIYSVANGEPDEALTINKSNVTIQGAADGTSILEGSSCGSWRPGIEIAVPASNVTIRNLTVRNFECDASDTGIRIASGDSGSIIEGCQIYNNDTGISIYESSPVIRKNRIYDNYRGIRVYGVTGTASPLIVNNLIYDTGGGTMDDGIYVSASSGTAAPTIYHNTIDNGVSAGIQVGYVNAGTPAIKYNIITNFDEYGIYCSLSSSIENSNNTVWGNALDYTNCAAGSGDISADPNYIDSASQNYDLNDGSPCIDAIPATEADPVSDDFDGNSRPQGDGYDMGAYESTVWITETVPIPPGIVIEDYRMVSFTVDPGNPSCTAVFGPEMGGSYDRDDYRFGRYNATLNGGSYEECGSDLQIVPGHAYWVIARYGIDLTVEGPPASMGDAEVELLYNTSNGNGWNQIGCPNPASYAWDDVQVLENGVVVGAIGDLTSSNEWIDKRLWCWENGSYFPDNVFLEPGEGYWVLAKKANVSLKFLQSTQIAQISNKDIMFAGLLNKAKRWMKDWILAPDAIADSNDSPPMPMGIMGASESESADTTSEGDGGGSGGGGGGCFVDALR